MKSSKVVQGSCRDGAVSNSLRSEKRHQLFKVNLQGLDDFPTRHLATSCLSLCSCSFPTRQVGRCTEPWTREDYDRVVNGFTADKGPLTCGHSHRHAWQDTLRGREAFHFKGCGWPSIWRAVYNGKRSMEKMSVVSN